MPEGWFHEQSVGVEQPATEQHPVCAADERPLPGVTPPAALLADSSDLAYVKHDVERPLRRGMSVVLIIAAVAVATTRQPVVHASAEDCAVIVEVGRHALGWGTAEPLATYLDADGDNGTVFREVCQWRKLGVPTPTFVAANVTGNMIFPPSYGGTNECVSGR